MTMTQMGLERRIVDDAVYARAVEQFRAAEVLLPTFEELSQPERLSGLDDRLAAADPDAPDPANLFRVHWYNASNRRDRSSCPAYVVLPPELTGVPARIVVLFGDCFPMIRAHKVLAAYACLAPRVVTGQFDPVAQRAVWPSTGNYCRGGIAISRIMGCHGVAVLPEGMSRERFEWLDQWVLDATDIVRTPGTESNVKEIYDKCDELARSSDHVIFNQFSEFGNYLAHFTCTGRAAEAVFADLQADEPGLRCRAFVAATGSAGTLAAGDYLKERLGASVVAAEALECPTMLCNGFGEHNIQGIGDKHIPLIHNVMNTDIVTAVSDRSTDALGVLFAHAAGKELLSSRGVDEDTIQSLDRFGLSSICNVLASIKTALQLGLAENDVVITVATDAAAMYGSEREKVLRRDYPEGFDDRRAADVWEAHLGAPDTENLLQLSPRQRNRIFNLGYFTWVEQRGVGLEDFVARREQRFWRDLRELVPVWDELIVRFNRDTGLAQAMSSPP